MEFSDKNEPLDIGLQERVLDRMFVFSDVGEGVIKCTIPDPIFDGDEKVEVEGKKYGIWNTPGLNSHAGSRVIERAIEKFIQGHGAPSWSQVVTGEVQDPTFNQLVQYPKTVYLKK